MKFVSSGVAALVAFGVAVSPGSSKAADDQTCSGTYAALSEAEKLVFDALKVQKLDLAGQRFRIGDGVIDVAEAGYSGMSNGNRTELYAKFFDLREALAITQKTPKIVCMKVSVPVSLTPVPYKSFMTFDLDSK